MNGFLHKLSPCPRYVIFDRKKYKKKKQKKKIQKKKQLYICFTFLCLINILHLFKEAYFCSGADRADFPLRWDTVQYVYVFLFICI